MLYTGEGKSYILSDTKFAHIIDKEVNLGPVDTCRKSLSFLHFLAKAIRLQGPFVLISKATSYLKKTKMVKLYNYKSM